MNTKSINFEPFVEWDTNPFILFSQKEKVIYLNHAAEILFGYVSKKELYNIAISYAPHNYGYKTTLLSLCYQNFNFHAVTIGYENDEEISMRLYTTPRLKPSKKIKKDKLVLTDINVLLEASITLFKTKNKNSIKLLTDQALPHFKIDQNTFSKLLRKTFDAFKYSDSINISLKLLVGEHLIIDNKKESIAQISIIANGRYVDNDEEIRKLSLECQTKPILKENSIFLEIPLFN